MTKNNKRHLAFVSDAIYPYNKGGKEKRLYDIAQILLGQGYVVDIYTMKWWDGPNTILIDGIRIHALCRSYDLYSGKRRSIKQGILFGLACFKLFNAEFDIVDVDQIPFFPIYSMWLVCLLRRKKLYVTWHEVWGKDYWQSYLKNFAGVASFIEKLSAYFPVRITAVSKTTAHQLATQLNRKNDVTVIPNAVDFIKIEAVPASKNKQDVIFAARLLKHKHADLLIEAIGLLKPSHPNIKCLIIGNGPEETTLKELANSLHLDQNVLFQGFFDDINDLYASIKSSKVYALPSEREGFGIGLLEANVCGIPAVTVNMPHNAAKSLIINNKNGSISKLTAVSLASSIEHWLNTTAKDVQKYVQPYQWKFMAAKLGKQYSQ